MARGGNDKFDKTVMFELEGSGGDQCGVRVTRVVVLIDVCSKTDEELPCVSENLASAL